MRILLVTHLYLPQHRAGTEIYTHGIAKELRERGHEVFVATTQKDIGRTNLSLREREVEGVPVLELTQNLFYRSFDETFQNPGVTARFREILNRTRPDVVHFMHLLYWSLDCATLARERGAKVFYTMHDFWLQCARFGQRLRADFSVCHTIDRDTCAACVATTKFALSPLQRRVSTVLAGVRKVTRVDLGPAGRRFEKVLKGRSRRVDDGAAPPVPGDVLAETARTLALREEAVRGALLAAVTRFFAPSRFLAEEFVQYGFPAAKVRYLRVGIDLEERALERIPAKDRSNENGSVRIAFIGTVAPHKGVHVLLDAWERLADKRGATLTIHGSLQHFPAYVAKVKTRAQEVGAEVAGAFARDLLPEILAKTDLLVVPSIWYENSPLVILEALKASIPLIVSDLGGMAELVREGVSGYRVPADDDRALADRLRAILEDPRVLMELPGDPGRAATMADNVDVLIEEYETP